MRAAALAGFGPGVRRVADYPGASGRGVRVAVVDSGVHAEHPHIGQRIAGGIGVDVAGRQTFDVVDRLGHGTAVVAAILEKAPDATVVPVKVFDGQLTTSPEALRVAIDWAVFTARVDVVNLSVGVANPAHEAILAATVAQAVAAGVLLVAAGPASGTRWLPGSLPGTLPVFVDWDCPRDEVHVSVDERVPSHPVAVRASGYPRPIPGVPPERNLKGVSFAVANVTGVLALHLSR